MTVAIYPGSFDPITFGHIDIARRAAESFDKLYIGIMVNPDKNYLFSIEERIKMTEMSFMNSKIEVISFDGLLVNFMKSHEVDVIVKGLRSFTDYEYEFTMANLNKKLYPKAETLFMITNQMYSAVSSSAVKNLFKFNADVSDFVPYHVNEALVEKFKK